MGFKQALSRESPMQPGMQAGSRQLCARNSACASLGCLASSRDAMEHNEGDCSGSQLQVFLPVEAATSLAAQAAAMHVLSAELLVYRRTIDQV